MNRLESRRPSQMKDIKVKMPIIIQIYRLETTIKMYKKKQFKF
jgi:hypothetical protein